MSTTFEFNTETAAGFLLSREPWFRVETMQNKHGTWDVVLRIDGSYNSEPHRELIRYFERYLNTALLDACKQAEEASA